MTKDRKVVLDKLNGLRESYIAGLPAKLSSIDAAWDAFEGSEGEPGTFQDLHRLVHSIAGSGATFGFPTLSWAARNLEVLIKTLIEGGHSLSQEHHRQIDSLLTGLRNAATESEELYCTPSLSLPRLAQNQSSIVVFVVEDDHHLAQELALQLHHAGYETSIFVTLEGFRNRMEKTPPAAILMDIIFPEGDLVGTEVINEIQHAREQRIPVIFMSVRDDITARLNAVRAGGTHYFTKPLKIEELIEALDEITTARPKDPYRVLIVDDDAPLSQMYAFALEQAGMCAVAVNDPMQALERIAEFRPELILMDVYMPNCQGTELATMIRQKRCYTNITIIFLSTETNFDKQMAALDLGGDDFLTKPVDLDSLIKMVRPRIKRVRALATLTRNLRNSEQQYRGVVENISSGIALVDRDMKILSFNPRMLQWFPQLCQGDVWDTPLHDLRQDDHDSEPPWILCGRDGRTHESVMQNSVDGAIRHYRIVSSAIPDESGAVNKVIQMVEDITERVRAEVQLQQAKEAALETQHAAEAANRAKSEFLANMSHEIRTPLNAVLGFTELLDALITDSTQRSYLESIKTGGRNLLTLISDILDLSKIEAGKLEIHAEPTSITAIVHEMHQVFRQKLAEKHLDFLIEIESDIPEYLLLDDVRVRQILLNLVGNAIKFTEQGYIKVSASVLISPPVPLLDLIIAVEDSGIGIPEAQQPAIFAAFTQQDGQSTKQYGGTGLGLTITKRLVNMMNGTIALKSDVNTGSTFAIVLKDVAACAARPESTRDQACDADRIVFEHAAVLVVDDVPSNRALIVGFLRKTALDVIEAENGEQALAFVREQPPDLILMDLCMPVLDGYEATRRIKEREDLRHIPVIALTATVLKESQAKIQAHGFDGYVKKPVTRSELFQELTRFLPYAEQQPALSRSDRDEQLGDIEHWAALPVDTLNALPEILQRLEDEFMPLWESIRQNGVFDEIEDFARQIAKFGENYSLTILEQFGNDLVTHVGNFDIDQIEANLDTYPQLIEHLRLKLED